MATFFRQYIVIGSKSEKEETLLTLVERKTRNTLVRKIQGKTMIVAMAEFLRSKEDFRSRFSKVFKTITSDDGFEFSDLTTLHSIDKKVYYTHPYAPFKRVTDECHNGLLRRFIPKRKWIADYSHEAIGLIED